MMICFNEAACQIAKETQINKQIHRNMERLVGNTEGNVPSTLHSLKLRLAGSPLIAVFDKDIAEDNYSLTALAEDSADTADGDCCYERFNFKELAIAEDSADTTDSNCCYERFNFKEPAIAEDSDETTDYLNEHEKLVIGEAIDEDAVNENFAVSAPANDSRKPIESSCTTENPADSSSKSIDLQVFPSTTTEASSQPTESSRRNACAAHDLSENSLDEASNHTEPIGVLPEDRDKADKNTTAVFSADDSDAGWLAATLMSDFVAANNPSNCDFDTKMADGSNCTDRGREVDTDNQQASTHLRDDIGTPAQTSACHNQEDVNFSASSAPVVTYSGSISLRSDSSTTSARSFAFPVLQREWTSSPVKMAKAHRPRFRKCGIWMTALLCCKF